MRLYRPWKEGGYRDHAAVVLLGLWVWWAILPHLWYERLIVTAIMLPLGLWLLEWHRWGLRR